MNFFDLHADIPLALETKSKVSAVDLNCIYIKNYVQGAAIWVSEKEKYPFKLYKLRLKLLKKYLSNQNISFNGANMGTGKKVVLSVENAAFLAENPQKILKLCNDKIKYLSLSWNNSGPLAGGAFSYDGVTEKGFEIINMLNRLNMALDISHLNMKSALQGIEKANTVLASHSCCYEVNAHKRNLTKEVLLKLMQKNGLIGLCFYPPFLGGNNVFEAIEKNIYYLCCLGMENNIAIGSDFDGGEMDKNLCKTIDVLKLYEYLCCKNLSKSLINKIFFANAIAFFEKICENKM